MQLLGQQMEILQRIVAEDRRRLEAQRERINDTITVTFDQPKSLADLTLIAKQIHGEKQKRERERENRRKTLQQPIDFGSLNFDTTTT